MEPRSFVVKNGIGYLSELMTINPAWKAQPPVRAGGRFVLLSKLRPGCLSRSQGSYAVCGLPGAGCGFADVVKVNAFLVSFDDFDAFNGIYREHFAPPFPARTTVQAGLYGFRIEIDALARRPGRA